MKKKRFAGTNVRKNCFLVFILLVVSLFACGQKKESPSVLLTYIGHSCYLIESSNGTRILFDPFYIGLGYEVPVITADIVIISHEDFDHSNVGMATGDPVVFRDAGEYKVGSFDIKGTLARHGRGKKKDAPNVLFTITVDGINFCHLGDIGEPITEEQLNSIGPVDVLFIPAISPLNPETADIVLEQLKPAMAFPIHYRTDATLPSYGMTTLDKFLTGKDNVLMWDSSEMELSQNTLPEKTQIVVMHYSAEKSPR